MEDNKEKVESTNNENKETKSQYQLNNENFTKTIIYSIIIIGIAIIHTIFAEFASGNLFWFIFNTICTIGEVVVGILGLKYMMSTIYKNKDKDIATFIVLIVALVFALTFALWYSSDAIRNLVGIFRN